MANVKKIQMSVPNYLLGYLDRVAGGKTLTKIQQKRLKAFLDSDPVEPDAGKVKEWADNLGELAGLLGVSRQSLDKWKVRGDAPNKRKGDKYHVASWVEYRDKNNLNPHGDLDAKEWDVRAKRAKALREEHRLKVEQGGFVDTETFEELHRKNVEMFVTETRRIFESDLPAITEGLDAMDVKRHNSQAIDQLLGAFNVRDVDTVKTSKSGSDSEEIDD